MRDSHTGCTTRMCSRTLSCDDPRPTLFSNKDNAVLTQHSTGQAQETRSTFVITSCLMTSCLMTSCLMTSCLLPPQETRVVVDFVWQHQLLPSETNYVSQSLIQIYDRIVYVLMSCSILFIYIYILMYISVLFWIMATHYILLTDLGHQESGRSYRKELGKHL